MFEMAILVNPLFQPFGFENNGHNALQVLEQQLLPFAFAGELQQLVFLRNRKANVMPDIESPEIGRRNFVKAAYAQSQVQLF